MAKVYQVAGLGQKPRFSTNLLALFRMIQTEAAGAKIFHGRPDMDKYRLKEVNNYAGLLVACKRDQFDEVPLFWSDEGATRLVKITKFYTEK